MTAPIEPCPLCKRPNLRPSDHHFVPKSRGGTVRTTICRDCHSAIHATFTNKELEAEYNTPEALLGHEAMARQIAFIARQDPGGKVQIAKSRRIRSR